MPDLARIAKRRTEAVLAHPWVSRQLGRSGRGKGLVLAYHGIVPHGCLSAGERSLHLGQHAFAAHLDLLVAEADVVPLEELVDMPNRQSLRPRIAITFDDAYVGAMTVGLQEVVKRGLPATVFVAPGCLGARFWWDELAESQGGRIHDRQRTVCLTEHRGAVESIRQLSGYSLGASLPPWCRAATERELSAAHDLSGVILGSHAWDHSNLARVGATELRKQLEMSLSWLRARFAKVLPAIAYPYGLLGRNAEQAVEGAGYRFGFEIAGGRLRPGRGNLFRLPRVNVPAGITIDGMALRIRGVLSR